LPTTQEQSTSPDCGTSHLPQLLFVLSRQRGNGNGNKNKNKILTPADINNIFGLLLRVVVEILIWFICLHYTLGLLTTSRLNTLHVYMLILLAVVIKRDKVRRLRVRVSFSWQLLRA